MSPVAATAVSGPFDVTDPLSPPSCHASAPPAWVDDADQLRERLAHRPRRIGVDTEFIRERTYWPKLALVQIALERDGEIEILLVDSLAPGINEALAPILADTATLKIMHSPSEDLVAFKHACATLPRPLFDTQLAAALAGIGGGMGYQKLVESITGIALQKGETRSDWLRRPLSASQLEYAADDVRHLFEMHDVLESLLEQKGRSGWLITDAERTLARADTDGMETWPHLSMRGAQFIDPDAQRRLIRLLRWREHYARESDRPRGWIIDNELAVLIARDTLADRSDLQSLLDRHPKAPRKLTDAIWEALHQVQPDEADAPDARAGEKRDKQKLRQLQDAVAARSAELGLPDGVLASRRHLENLMDHGQWPDAMAGWRRDELEPVLRPLLDEKH